MFRIMKWIIRIVAVLLVVGSLSLTAGTLMFSSVAFLVSNTIEAVSGAKTVYSKLTTKTKVQADKITTLSNDLTDKNKKLKTANNKITKQSDEIIKLGGKVKNLESNIAKKFALLKVRNDELKVANGTIDGLTRLSGAKLVKDRGNIKPALEAISDTSNRIFNRSVIRAGRNVGSLAGQAIPYVGIAALVIATGWDLQDSCDTVTDIQELQKAFGEKPNDKNKVCGLEVPSKEELWQSVKDSPQKAWEATKNVMPDLPSFSSAFEKTKEWLNPKGWLDWFTGKPDK
ncbi:MAG: hypothetical protein K8953_09880 [Proteobacteria bacterium]|nr:hypothetical protein [Pseudomonadota bacterium]